MNKSFIDGNRKIYITDDENLISIIDELFSNRECEQEIIDDVEPITYQEEDSKPVSNEACFPDGKFKSMTPKQVIEKYGFEGAMEMYKNIKNCSEQLQYDMTIEVKRVVAKSLKNITPSSSMKELRKFVSLYGCMLKKQVKTLLSAVSYHSTDEFFENEKNERVIHDFYEKLYDNLKERVE